MKEPYLEAKVGLFVIIALALVTVLFFNLDVLHTQSGYRIGIHFRDAGGLETGSPVQLAGVTVGLVEEIHVRRDSAGHTYVDVKAAIEDGVTIQEDADASVTTGGLLGQKYLQIYPGSPDTTALKNGDTIRGLEPVTIERVARAGQRIVSKLESSVDYLNTLIGDEEFRVQMKDNVIQLGGMLGDLKDSTASLKVVLARLEKGEGTIGKLLTEEEVYDDVKELVADVKRHPWKLLKKK